MRLQLLTQHFPPSDNAAARRWWWLACALAERGWDVDVIGPQHPGPNHAGVQVHPGPARTSGGGLVKRAREELQLALSTFRTSRRLPAPALIIGTVPALGLMPSSWLLSRLRRVPWVLDLRDTWPELLGEWRTWTSDGTGVGRAPQPWLAPVFAAARWALERIRRRADLVVVTTGDFADHLRRTGHPRVLTVRSLPCRTLDLPPPEQQPGSLRVLYLGTVGRAQNLATAIDAAVLASSQADVRLRIVGTGAHVERLQAYAAERSAPVEFFGHADPDAVEEHHRWCDSVLVMLRDWPTMRWTVPSKLYEAVGSGRHVSASLSGEAARLVEEAGAGDVTPPGDARALADLWIRLAASGAPAAPLGDTADERATAADALDAHLRALLG